MKNLAFSLANSNLTGIIKEATSILNSVIPILVGLAMMAFFWGLSKFILSSNNSDGIKKGQEYMLWGILALFILFTFSAIIGLVSSEFEIGSKSPIVPLLKRP